MSGGGVSYTQGVMTSVTTNAFTEVDLGFVPDRVVLFLCYESTGGMILDYDVVNNKLYRTYNIYHLDLTSTFIPAYVKMDGTKLCYKAASSSYATTTEYIAVKE